ncbi:MAG: hypothetical protein M3O70_07455, partial [Actinomycetota bacterium]|nr:hypothetical protein [Actinomycetota bacterium]
EVCWGEGVERSEVLGLVLRLVERSLVQPSHNGEEVRYRLLDTIRHYGREVLNEAGEAAAVKTRHLRYYRALAERYESELEANDPSALDRMERELDNLRAASEWAAQAGLAEDGLRLAAPLSFLWAARGLALEAKRHLQSLLSLPAPQATRAMALTAAAHVALNSGDIASTQAFAQEALTVDAGDERSVGRALTLLGWAASFTEPAMARPLLEQAAGVCRESGDAHFLAFSLSGLGSERIHAGEVTEARALLGEALGVARAAGDRRGMMGNLFRLGWAVALQGDLVEARQLAEECLALARTLRDPPFEAAALQLLGSLAMLQGKGESAKALLAQSLALARDSGALYATALALWGLGLAQHQTGDRSGASRDLNQALGMLRPLQLEPFVTWCLLILGDVAEASGDLNLASARRDEAVSEARASGNAWALGRALIGHAHSLRLAGEVQKSESLLHQALGFTAKSGDEPGTVAALESVAGLTAEQGRLTEAARVFAAAQTARQAAGYARLFPARQSYAADLARVRTGLDPASLPGRKERPSHHRRRSPTCGGAAANANAPRQDGQASPPWRRRSCG